MKKSRILPILLLLAAALLFVWTSRSADGPVEPEVMPPPAASPPANVEAKHEPATVVLRSPRVSPAIVGPDARGMSFSGRVISRATGAAVPDAELTFEHGGGAHTVKTEGDGAFRFAPVEPGGYRLAGVTAPDYLPFAPAWGESPLLLTAREGKHVRDVTIELEPAKEIAAKVVDPNGAPVSGATVTLRVSAAEEMSAAAPASEHTTDASGMFRFQAPLGTALEARHPDFAPTQARFERADWDRGSLTIQLRAKASDANQYRIAGRVVDGSGTGLPEVTVTATRDFGERHALDAAARTDSEGAFVFVGLAPGTYELAASSPGLVPDREKGVAIGRTDVELRLDASGGFITGHITSEPNREPVASFAVIVSESIGRLEETQIRTESFLDADGEFSIGPLEAKSYRVRAVAHGYAQTEPIDVRVSVGSRSEADFLLEKGARLLGVVLDGTSQKAIAGARVTVEGRPQGDGLPIPIEAAAATDDQGRFELPSVAPGLHSVSASAKGYNIRIVSGLDFPREGTLGPIEIRLTPLEDADAAPKRELEGIGAALSAEGDVVVIQQVIAGGGASEAGLVAGDKILRIDGQTVGELDFNGVIQRIRGPVGTTLELAVQRAGGEEQTIVVSRKKIVN